MMRTSLLSGLGLVVAAGLLGGTSTALADACLNDARVTYGDCKGDCREALQVAKDSCLNRDHACVEVCRAQREDCRVATGFDAAIAACNATLRAARQTCRGLFDPDTVEFDHCVDQAQVVAFQCRDKVRETHKTALGACRTQFRTCARACGPANPPNPTDTKTCKMNANTAYKQCGAACREDFQVNKDACLHRDHDCVEICRAQRDTCNDPVQAQLAVSIGACNNTRDAEIATCKTLYGDGTPERTQCIDNAQVEAFICRDTAKEAAKPGFQACRQQFKSCVQACPAPSPSGAFLDEGALTL